MADFATDTAVAGGGGRFRARLSPDWEVWGPNGGYLAALALRAAGAATELPRPAGISCHFLSVARFEAVDLCVTPLHAGKRAASLRVSMQQAERPILEALVWVVGRVDGLRHDLDDMPEVPPPERLPSIEDLLPPEERAPYRFWDNIERRPIDWVHPRAWQPGLPPTFRSWFRFRPRAIFDDPFLDAARALLLIDTLLWPAAWQRHGDGSGFIAPNLDVTARFHHLPATPWLLAAASAPVAAEGLIGGEARVWSSDGRLVASGGGQLLCRPVPSP